MQSSIDFAFDQLTNLSFLSWRSNDAFDHSVSAMCLTYPLNTRAGRTYADDLFFVVNDESPTLRHVVADESVPP